MKLYNSLNKQKENITDDNIYWYTCGPTVYDHSHLGHARTYLTIDIMKRVIGEKKQIIDIMNITDIDDKIINKAGNKWYQLARHFENEFFEDMKSLGIKKPSIITRVSDYIPEIILFIQKLLDKGFAYTSNYSIYFDVHKYIEQGGKFNFREFNTKNGKFNTKNNDKKNIEDFALWKKSDDIGWNTPFFKNIKGRPGWHIECSVMAMDVLNKINNSRLTIHSGGIDLAFPHHENEIIQSQSYLGLDTEEWSKFFVHIGHLHIQGLKMSKSLKNFITIKEFLQNEKNGANILRMMTLLTKYNKTLNYNNEYVEYCKNELNKIENYLKYMENYNRLHKHVKFNIDSNVINKINNIIKIIEDYIENDFDTPNAMQQLFILIEFGYNSNNHYIKNIILEIVNKYYNLFGFNEINNKTTQNNNKYIDIILKIRNDIRNEAKNNKKLYQISDKIRDVYLKDYGIQDL